MSSVAKCLVLAGVALEADALLLQTGTTECKQHGCSGSDAAGGNDICKAYDVTKNFDENKKKSATVAAGAKEPTDGKVKIDNVEYSCKEKECPRGENKKMEKTKPENVQANLTGNTGKVADMCAESQKAKDETKEEKKEEAKDICEAIADVKAAAEKAIVEVKKVDGTNTVTMKFGDDDKRTYKCEQAKECNVKDGTQTGDKAKPKPEDVDAAAVLKKSYKSPVTNTAFKTECAKA